jgi:hypothetical protein
VRYFLRSRYVAEGGSFSVPVNNPSPREPYS